MKTELCDFCGVDINTCFETRHNSATYKISSGFPGKEPADLTLCSKCNQNLIHHVSTQSRKEWKQEAKRKLKELFP